MTPETNTNYPESAGINIVALYLQEISVIPLLTVEEEIRLGKLIKEGQLAKEKLFQKGLKEEERPRLNEQKASGKAAVAEMVKCNLRLAFSVARKAKERSKSDVLLLDLVQEGNLGLIDAAERFDYEMGWRFSTYAVWWIRVRIRRFINNQGGSIYLPDYQGEKFRHIWTAKEILREDLGREPTDEELAEELEMSPWRLAEQRAKYATVSAVSLNMPVYHDGEEGGSELGDFISDTEGVDPEESVMNKDREERVEKVLSELSPREQEILRKRFGIGCDHAYTLEEVGQEPHLRVSKERIRQLEKEALRKLNAPRCKERLRGLL